MSDINTPTYKTINITNLDTTDPAPKASPDERQCLEQGIDKGWTCTRVQGHDGSHVPHMANGEECKAFDGGSLRWDTYSVPVAWTFGDPLPEANTNPEAIEGSPEQIADRVQKVTGIPFPEALTSQLADYSVLSDYLVTLCRGLEDTQHLQVKAVEDLNGTILRLTQERNTAYSVHQKDIDMIGERFIQEATDRGYCSAYDDVIESLNSKLNRQLPVREQEYTITRTYTVTVYTTVMARDEDAASEQADDFSDRFTCEDWEVSDQSLEDQEITES